MEFVKVSTTQNIDLEYNIAGIGDRILAFFVRLFGYDCLGLNLDNHIHRNRRFATVAFRLYYSRYVLYVAFRVIYEWPNFR